MTRRGAIAAGLAGGWCAARAAQNAGGGDAGAPETIAVFAEHPRLLLTRNRLRLLRRERERRSGRWQQLELFLQGNAPMPERGMASALYFQIAGDEKAGRQAVTWALGSSADVRQQALVFDWCQELLSKAQSSDLAGRLERVLARPAADASVSTARTRAFAAIALYDHSPQAPRRELERIVRDWWQKKTAPALKAGRPIVARDDAYPLWELMHAVRDAANIELRESAPLFFKEFPIEHLLSHYPASFPAAENEFRIGATVNASPEPDLRAATLSRAAELAMVAYDVNAASSQVLQGWLMHDRFAMRGTFGIVYEFLWANPYHPGLSYYHVPLVYHNPEFGKLFIRSNWDDTADWFGYFNGVAQLFSQGQVTVLNPKLRSQPLGLTEAMVMFGESAKKFRTKLEEEEAVFVVGLKPRQMYLVEVDQEEAYEAATDPGGILPLDLPRKTEVGVRMRELEVAVRQKERTTDISEKTRAPRGPAKGQDLNRE
jgi:hypothetical protein